MQHTEKQKQLDAQITSDRKGSTYTNTNGTNGLILFPSPADQNGGLLVGNIYIYMI